MIELRHRSAELPSLRSARRRFIVLSGLFFVTATLIFVVAFSALRINLLKAEQATAASAFISELTSIVESTGDEDLPGIARAFLGTLVGGRVFSCISLRVDSMNKVYSWPSENCRDSPGGEPPHLEVTSTRVDGSASPFHISAFLDEWAPIEKYAEESAQIAVSALAMGLFALLAINFAFNRAVRRPLKFLLDDVLGALAGSDAEVIRNNESDSGISRFAGTYEAMLARAKELRRKEAFWRAVGDSAFDCIISADHEGRIIDFNAAAEETFGYKRDKVLGRQISDVLVPDRYREAHKAGWARYLSTGENQVIGKNVEVEALKSDGTEIRVELWIAAMELEGEQFFTAYLRDITERIEREDELRQAKNLAEQASKAKSSFLAMMSHEIRTPLNAVLGALGLIDNKDLEPSQKKFLEVGKKGAESLLFIINDILDFSKMEAGKLHLEPTPFHLRETIDDVLMVLEQRALEKAVSLTEELNADVPDYLIGDASRIRQVLLNLGGNAVKFTDEGSVRIKVSNLQQVNGVARLRFEVEDTGIGTPEEHQEHLFEEFWGTTADTLDGASGTGLGLAISKHLVEMMGGSIGFDSEPGRGSNFWFELPLQLPGEDAVKIEQSKRRSLRMIAPYTDFPLLQGRVLLAEDNPTNQLIARAMLERFGLQVEVVANGHEVVAALRDRPYDCVLMDINMPEMDGVQATAAIRKLPGASAETPVVAMTALAMRGDRERLLAQGLDDYISKPISREELHGCIERVLRGTKPSQPDSVGSTNNGGVDADLPIIDSDILSELGENVGAELLPEIIDTFLSECAARVDAIAAASATGDCALVAKEAHPLKSSSANIGALRLADLARVLEHAGREQNLETIVRDVSQLSDLSKQTREDMLRLRRGDYPVSRDDSA
ncbi:MAG: PAS domain S-box protein [Gammaproteobacteria bacterium]|jgi:PAS domain S-box-containing protein|nr:PAS domain S-box protein [Gammaproteobacteria bacterium]